MKFKFNKNRFSNNYKCLVFPLSNEKLLSFITPLMTKINICYQGIYFKVVYLQNILLFNKFVFS